MRKRGEEEFEILKESPSRTAIKHKLTVASGAKAAG